MDDGRKWFKGTYTVDCSAMPEQVEVVTPIEQPQTTDEPDEEKAKPNESKMDEAPKADDSPMSEMNGSSTTGEPMSGSM